eukprot:1268925-Rhodomonas_salina.4
MADQGTEAHRLEENHPKVLLINVEVLRVASVPVESDLLLIKNRIFDQTVSNLTRSSVENSHFGMNDLALSPKWKESRVVAEVQLLRLEVVPAAPPGGPMPGAPASAGPGGQKRPGGRPGGGGRGPPGPGAPMGGGL